jgi:hypothetical protein
MIGRPESSLFPLMEAKVCEAGQGKLPPWYFQEREESGVRRN